MKTFLILSVGIVAMVTSGVWSFFKSKPSPDFQYDRFVVEEHKTQPRDPDLWLIRDSVTEAEYLVTRSASGTAIIQLRK